MIDLHTLMGLLPVVVPAIGGIWILIVLAVAGDRALRDMPVHTLALLVLSGVSAILLLVRGYSADLVEGALRIDSQALVFHLIFVTVAILTVLTAATYLKSSGAAHGEFYALILFAVCGMTIMAGSGNLLSLFLGLEILSICLYALAGFTRTDSHAIEGALKYFLLGAFSTGFILYGIALLYGATGRIDLDGIAAHLTGAMPGEVDPLVLAGTALLLVGLAFKVAAVPFHFWAPDVYQGSMTPVSGFMAAGTKAAAFAMLLRILTVGLGDGTIREQWIAVLSGIALLTMIVGNIVALAQQNIKRMLAYSSIANAGYLLVAVVAGGRRGGGPPLVVFYLAAYTFMTLGAFAVAALLGRTAEGDAGYEITSYAGLARRRPYLAAAMAVFMLSLTGIPPTGGFMGKFYVFKAAIDAGMYDLAVVGLLASVVGAVYYLRVVVQMYLRDPAAGATLPATSPGEALAIFLAAAGTLWIGLFPTGLLQLARLLG